MEQAPQLSVEEGLDLAAQAGSSLTLTCTATGNALYPSVSISARIYEEASSVYGAQIKESTDSPQTFNVRIPESAQAGQTIHVLVQAKNQGGYELTHYQQVIITIA